MHFIDQTSQFYIVRNHDVLLNATPEKIWPHVLRFESYNRTFEKVELLFGKQDAVGSISLLTKQAGEMYMPPYLVKVIDVKPNRQIVWKMYPRSGNEFYCMVDFSLEPVGKATRFYVDVYSENLVPIMSEKELEALKREVHGMYDKLIEIMFTNIKKLAEGA
jgi:hypothetical protein